MILEIMHILSQFRDLKGLSYLPGLSVLKSTETNQKLDAQG